MSSLSQLILTSWHFLLLFYFFTVVTFNLFRAWVTAQQAKVATYCQAWWPVWFPVSTWWKDRISFLRLSSDLCMPAVAHACPPIHKWNHCKNKRLHQNCWSRSWESVFCKLEDLSLVWQKSWACLLVTVVPSLTGGFRSMLAISPHFPLASKLINVASTLRRLKVFLKLPSVQNSVKEAKFLATQDFYQISGIWFRKIGKNVFSWK